MKRRGKKWKGKKRAGREMTNEGGKGGIEKEWKRRKQKGKKEKKREEEIKRETE